MTSKSNQVPYQTKAPSDEHLDAVSVQSRLAHCNTALVLQCHRAMLLDGTAAGQDALREVLDAGFSPSALAKLAAEYQAIKAIDYMAEQGLLSSESIKDVVLLRLRRDFNAATPLLDHFAQPGMALSQEKSPSLLASFCLNAHFEEASAILPHWDLVSLTKEDLDHLLVDVMTGVFNAESEGLNAVKDIDKDSLSEVWCALVDAGANPYLSWDFPDNRVWVDRLTPQEATVWWPECGFRNSFPPPSASPIQMLLIVSTIFELVSCAIPSQRALDHGDWWTRMVVGLDPKKIGLDVLDRGPWALLMTGHKNGAGQHLVLDQPSWAAQWLLDNHVDPSEDPWPVWEMTLLQAQAGHCSYFMTLTNQLSSALSPRSIDELQAASSRLKSMFGPAPSGAKPFGSTHLWWNNHALQWGENALPDVLMPGWVDQVERMKSMLEMQSSPERTALEEGARFSVSSLWKPLLSIPRSPRL